VVFTVKLKIFSLRFADGFDDAALQAFIADKEVIEFSEHFFVHERTPYLTVIVSYREIAADERRRGFPRDNPRNELDESEAKAYDALRVWRGVQARQDGVPPYMIVNNGQIARLVKLRAATKADLAKVNGIGEQKIEHYGAEILKIIAEHLSPAVATASETNEGGAS
jgi:superfamily II DNA helicase RecQ